MTPRQLKVGIINIPRDPRHFPWKIFMVYYSAFAPKGLSSVLLMMDIGLFPV